MTSLRRFLRSSAFSHSVGICFFIIYHKTGTNFGFVGFVGFNYLDGSRCIKTDFFILNSKALVS